MSACEASAMDFAELGGLTEPVPRCDEEGTVSVGNYTLCAGCAEALQTLGGLGALVERLRAAYEEKHGPQDDYKGAEGWVVVAVGLSMTVFMAIDPGFGALRFDTDEAGLLPDECGLDLPSQAKPGVYLARARYHTFTSWEGEVEGEYDLTEPWREVTWPMELPKATVPTPPRARCHLLGHTGVVGTCPQCLRRHA